MKVCLRDPKTGEIIVCVEIPMLVRQWPPVDPSRGLEDLKNGGLPDPWLKARGLKATAARDLQTLASIHALSATLSKTAKAAVQETVRAQVGGIKLPAGLEVGFDR